MSLPTRTCAVLAALAFACCGLAGCSHSDSSGSHESQTLASDSKNPRVTASKTETPTTESSSAPDTTPTPTMSLPAGVWSGVAQGVPQGAHQITTTNDLGGPADGETFAVIQLPDGSVGCEVTLQTPRVLCQIPKANFECLDAGGPDKTNENCAATIQKQMPTADQIYSVTDLSGYSYAKAANQPIQTVDYGSTVIRGDFACHAEKNGMTCWNIKTKHGALFSVDGIVGF